MSASMCGIDCSLCEQRGRCKGCAETMGKPFGGSCAVAQCCVENGHDSCKNCLLSSNGNGDLIYGIADAIVLFQFFRNCATKLDHTAADGVFSKSIGDSFDTGDLDVIEGALIRFTNIKFNYIFSFRFQLGHSGIQLGCGRNGNSAHSAS